MNTPYPLKMVRQVDERFLLNTSDRAVHKLVYSLGHCYTDFAGADFFEADPHYELHDLPAHSHLSLGDVDPQEDELVCWHIDEIVWDDASTAAPMALQRELAWERDELPGQRVERSLIRLDPIG